MDVEVAGSQTDVCMWFHSQCRIWMCCEAFYLWYRIDDTLAHMYMMMIACGFIVNVEYGCVARLSIYGTGLMTLWLTCI